MSTINESNKKWNRNVINAYSRVLKFIPRIASGLLSLGFLGYIVGWLRARSYFSQFDAAWILDSISSMHLINLSVFPILAILISLIITMTDIAERFKIYENKTVLILIAGFILMHLGGIVLDHYAYYDRLVNIAYIKVFYSAMILTVIFGEKVIQLRKTNYKWSSQKIWELSLWVFLFLLSTSSLGTAEGKLNSTSTYTNLPVVNLETNDNDQEWRLLYLKDENLYLTELKPESPKIKIVKLNEVTYIQ